MRKDDVAAFARWNQDLEFTALIGSPGEVHTLEMREEFYERNSKIRPDCIEFAVISLSTGRLIGFGGLFDMNRSLMGTMFVGIGEPELRGRGHGIGQPADLRIWILLQEPLRNQGGGERLQFSSDPSL
jgi:RimJ/RimL family protein N-acetyltransferase